MRKGISPLVAATLLIAFTLTIALLVGPFFSDTIQTSQEGQTEKVQGLLESAKSSLTIENATYAKNNEEFTVLIRNNGQTNITGFSATVLGEEPNQRTFESTTIESGETFRFTIGAPNNVEKDEINVEALNKAVRASMSLDSIITGTAPASPSGLDATS